MPNTPSAFRPDGSSGYLGAELLCEADPPYAYLYAVRTGDGSQPPGDEEPPGEEEPADTVTVTLAEYDDRKQELRATPPSPTRSSSQRTGTRRDSADRATGACILYLGTGLP